MAEMKDFYLLMGRYDLLVVVELLTPRASKGRCFIRHR